MWHPHAADALAVLAAANVLARFLEEVAASALALEDGGSLEHTSTRAQGGGAADCGRLAEEDHTPRDKCAVLSAEGQAPGSEAEGSSGEHPLDYPEIELMHWQHRESVRLVFQDAVQIPAGRDALVRRCCAGVAPQDRQGFIDELRRVAGPLSQDSLSKCLHAFHLMHPLVWSNSQKRAVRRGPRPRRCRPHEVAASEMAAVETSDACVRAELSRGTAAAGPLAIGGDAPQGLGQMRAVGPVTTVDSNRVGSREMAAGTRSIAKVPELYEMAEMTGTVDAADALLKMQLDVSGIDRC